MGKNSFKEIPEPEKIPEEKPEPPKKKAKTSSVPEGEKKKSSGNLLKGILDGTILTRQFVLHSIPMILLVVFLGIIFIANRYSIETTSLEINKLKKELEHLRNKQINFKNKYEQASSINEIQSALDSTGIKQSTERPQKIILKEND